MKGLLTTSIYFKLVQVNFISAEFKDSLSGRAVVSVNFTLKETTRSHAYKTMKLNYSILTSYRALTVYHLNA